MNTDDLKNETPADAKLLVSRCIICLLPFIGMLYAVVTTDRIWGSMWFIVYQILISTFMSVLILRLIYGG